MTREASSKDEGETVPFRRGRVSFVGMGKGVERECRRRSCGGWSCGGGCFSGGLIVVRSVMFVVIII